MKLSMDFSRWFKPLTGAQPSGTSANYVNAASLFDVAFYLRCDAALAKDGTDPIEHYLESGAKEGRAPHPLFDTRWYLATYPDVAADGVNPLIHYVTLGKAEGRAPNPLFDPIWYSEQNVDVLASNIDPFQHYVLFGSKEGRSPHPLFDLQWYIANNPDVVAASVDPLSHYLVDGFREGRSPHPLFDGTWYLATNPEIAEAGLNPLLHYVDSGRAEHRRPNPFFDPSWYLSQNPDVSEAGLDPFYHYVRSGEVEGRSPHPDFNAKWYRRFYRDLIESANHPLRDYIHVGQHEGRAPNPADAKRQQPVIRPVSDAVLIPVTSRARKPVVLIVTHDCSLTGAPMTVLNLAEYLLEVDTVDVVVISKKGGLLAERFAALPDFRILGEDTIAELEKVVVPLSGRPLKVAFCNTVVTADLMVPLRRHGFRIISLVHEMPAVVEQFDGSLIRDIDDIADAMVFGSAFVRDAILEAYNPKNTPLFIVPTGVFSPNLTQENIAAARSRLRAEAGCPPDAFLVLGCGTVEYRKGVDIFIAVAQHVLRSRDPGSDIFFVWIGAPTQPYMNFCVSDIEKFGLSSHVKLLDARPNLMLLLPGADLFALTSREDPFPLVTLNAMASGVPPLVFDRAGGSPDAVANGAGEIVPYLDVAAMAKVIQSLATDADRRASIRFQALDRYRERYTPKAFANGLSHVLTSIGAGVDLAAPTKVQSVITPRSKPTRLKNNQVSVVIPSYNHSSYVEAAIRSVLDQDEPIFELIIIDDASQDTSDEIIRRVIASYGGPVEIRYERLKKNGGAHAAIMRGLSLARGEVLTILNSDDYYTTDRFRILLAHAPAEGDFIAFSGVKFIDENGDDLGKDSGIAGWYKTVLTHALECPSVGYALLRNNIAVTSGNIVFTRELYRKIGGFARYKMCHDWDFLIRASHYVEPIFVQEVRMAYRVHPTNTLNSTRHLLLEEGMSALNGFVELTRHELSPNPLAPSLRNWPIYFDYFIDAYPSWFAPEPMRTFIRGALLINPLPIGEWRFGGQSPASELGFLNAQCSEQDAFALRRALALGSRPVSVSRVGFGGGTDVLPHCNRLH